MGKNQNKQFLNIFPFFLQCRNIHQLALDVSWIKGSRLFFFFFFNRNTVGNQTQSSPYFQVIVPKEFERYQNTLPPDQLSTLWFSPIVTSIWSFWLVYIWQYSMLVPKTSDWVHQSTKPNANCWKYQRLSKLNLCFLVSSRILFEYRKGYS